MAPLLAKKYIDQILILNKMEQKIQKKNRQNGRLRIFLMQPFLNQRIKKIIFFQWREKKEAKKINYWGTTAPK
jgi:hypothetical protein